MSSLALSNQNPESKTSKHFIIKMLQQQLNELNRECQESQKLISIELKKLFESRINTSNNKIFRQKFDELFADYSININEIGLNYIVKIRSYLEDYSYESSQSHVVKNRDPNNTQNIPTTYINVNDNNYPNCVNLSSMNVIIDNDDQIADDVDDDMINYTYKQCDQDDDDDQNENKDDNESTERVIITRRRSKSMLGNDNNKQIKCKQCDKIFQSSQALAGHLKVHNNKSKTRAQSKLKHDAVFECHICHKKFLSHKSLSGHKGGAHKDYFTNGKRQVSFNKKMKKNISFFY